MPHDGGAAFLDTAYVYARVNVRDQWHQQAVQWEERLSTSRRPLVTSEFVLVEIADGLAAVKFRLQAAAIIAALQASLLVEIVPATSTLFEAAVARACYGPEGRRPRICWNTAATGSETSGKRAQVSTSPSCSTTGAP